MLWGDSMRYIFLILISFVLFGCAATDTGQVTRSGPVAVAHGGGSVYTGSSSGVRLDRAFSYPMSLAGGRSASIVTIKSAETDTDQSLARLFRSAGYRNTSHITVTDISAVAQIMAADVIYFDGGVQTRLMRKLNAHPSVRDAIRARYAQGAVVAGISAGAAALSDLMICCDRGGKAIPSRGLALLPNVVIDQHYSERGRQFRLAQIISANPEKIGVGIDEEMAVAFQGTTARVIGSGGRVTIVRFENGELVQESFGSGTIDISGGADLGQSGRSEPVTTTAAAPRILPRPLVIEGNRRLMCASPEAVRTTIGKNGITALREGAIVGLEPGCKLSSESIPIAVVQQSVSEAPSVSSDGQQLFLSTLPDGRSFTVVR